MSSNPNAGYRRTPSGRTFRTAFRRRLPGTQQLPSQPQVYQTPTVPLAQLGPQGRIPLAADPRMSGVEQQRYFGGADPVSGYAGLSQGQRYVLSQGPSYLGPTDAQAAADAAIGLGSYNDNPGGVPSEGTWSLNRWLRPKAVARQERIGGLQEYTQQRQQASDEVFRFRGMTNRDQARIDYGTQRAQQEALDASARLAALNTQYNLLTARRDQALKDGLQAVADQFDRDLGRLDKEREDLEGKVRFNDEVAAWYTNVMQPGLARADRAAEAVETAGALAAMEAATAEFADKEAQMNERLGSVLSSIGFSPEGIQALQSEAKGLSLFDERQGIITAQGDRRENMALLQRELEMARASGLRAATLKENEATRYVNSERLKRALAENDDARVELEEVRAEAMERTRRGILEKFGEDYLPSREEFVSQYIGETFNTIAPNLPAGQRDAYAELAFGLYEAFGETPTTSIRAQIEGIWKEQGLVKGRDYDDEDIAIVRAMYDGIVTVGAQWDSIQATRSSGAVGSGATNTDPAALREVESYLKTGAITGPYSQRAYEVKTVYAPTIRDQWGLKVEGVDYMRPLSATGEGRSSNSDHFTAGALDVFFRTDSDLAKLQPFMTWVNMLQSQGIIASVVQLGANGAHDDHVHISFALPYGGIQPVQDTFAGGKSTQDQTFDEQMAAAVTPTPTVTTRQVAQ